MKAVAVGFLMVALGVGLTSASALAQDAIAAPGQKAIGVTQTEATQMIPSLAVLNSGGASLSGGKLIMTDVASNAIVFADRPVRAAGHTLTKDFLKDWDEGEDSFAKDPPNATISVLKGDGSSVEDAVVVLMKPTLEGKKLTFDVKVLEGSLAGADGPAALFIDWFAARGAYGGGVAAGGWHGAYRYHGAWGYHAPVWHGAWYAHPAYPVGAAAGIAAGAALGAAAATAAHPYCGYYPYPPCY